MEDTTLKGSLGEDEFSVYLKKMNFTIKTKNFFWTEPRNACFYPIKTSITDDHGQDFYIELCWKKDDEKGHPFLEPAGLHVAVQIKTYSGKPSLDYDAIEYYEKLSFFVPVIIVWQKVEKNQIIERKVCNWISLKTRADYQEKIIEIKLSQSKSTWAIPPDAWQLFNENWCKKLYRRNFY